MSNTMFLFLLCINLFAVTPSAGSVLKCVNLGHGKRKIYIIKKPSQELLSQMDFEQIAFSELNNKFMEKCEHFYNFKVSKYNTRINDTLEAIKKEINVINLWVRDYYDYPLDEYSYNQLVYAGDIVYKPMSKSELDISDKNPKFVADVGNNCEIIKKPENEKQIAKVVSNNVTNINSGDLVDFISSIQYYDLKNVTSRASCLREATDTTDLKIVLICSDNWKYCLKRNKPYAKNLEFIFKSTSACGYFTKMFQHNILAVLAPTPFEMEYEITIPTIFYETPYMNSEYKTRFPNSMNLISGLLLKHAFMKFINDAGWRRVAIISDDAPYSTDFEREILELFHEKQILYNVQQCENENDLKKALTYLMTVDARIIIANVNEENAKKITTIFPLDKTRFTILFRVPAVWDWMNYKNWVTITMGPSETGYETCHVVKSSTCLGIMQSLDIVVKARAEHSHPEELHRATFYSKFTKTMLTKIQPGSTAYVSRWNEAISKMYITNNGKIINVETTKRPFDEEVLDQNQCIAKVNNFSRPCDNSVYLYFMLVVIMFAITLLTITCYFHESSPLISKSYQQL